ncbi:YopJ family type III secretion system effector serine/threonine acetyltransferase [Salmonella enterica]|uniref:YopJ family type III secretion system effector serine/threonine acetyltransferase n=1 Tax=Salmonella enterica subsp. VII serovar 40:z4,z24:[z39] TaxID=1967625 RepID=A0A731XTT1_SALEE|nr:YopJ family type III secretion system effector serine/threonine acetyltransferase [Salmonella enterica]EDO5295129.1 YopJ family type III secretion system effector serine/threonine acetyltransferase [Salmonella enterica subsp. houtenae serovar 40:z4,z24:-]EDS6439273.1 YopJ family type III secretion system effector serine/threonine acetyltransferase [Salmonella enterica subsp. VII str. CFSAN000550]EDT6884724.1 YopJ family type III secretion system effector serine/threonine acetyltransferase [Sa
MLSPTTRDMGRNPSPQPEASAELNTEALTGIIERLENESINGSWINASYEAIDLEIMPFLVEQANKKYPALNLKFFISPHELVSAIKEARMEGAESARFIVNMGDSGIHFSAVDFRVMAGKTSVILFEPAAYGAIGPALLALRTKAAIEREQLSNCYFAMVELDIQRSSSECGIFSLALAKKLHLESENLADIHADNINERLCGEDYFLSYDKADRYLPVSFYKHTQGIHRLNEYVKANPEAESSIVNKKNETLYKRFDNNTVMLDDRKLSISSHRKRITEYKSLLKS